VINKQANILVLIIGSLIFHGFLSMIPGDATFRPNTMEMDPARGGESIAPDWYCRIYNVMQDL
jgi:hypothetical protein